MIFQNCLPLADNLQSWLNENRDAIDNPSNMQVALVEGLVQIEADDDPVGRRRRNEAPLPIWQNIARASNKIFADDPDMKIALNSSDETLIEAVLRGRTFIMAIAMRQALKERLNEVYRLLGREAFVLQPRFSIRKELDGFSVFIEPGDDVNVWGSVNLTYTAIYGAWGFWSPHSIEGSREKEQILRKDDALPAWTLPIGPHTPPRR